MYHNTFPIFESKPKILSVCHRPISTKLNLVKGTDTKPLLELCELERSKPGKFFGRDR